MRQIPRRADLIIVAWITMVMYGIIMGCTAFADGVQSNQLESHIDSNGTADDHFAAALLYEQKAERARAEAARYEQEASAINPIEDPKGFRRNALITAAKERRQEAAEMQRMYVTHQTKAQTMTGKQQPR